MERTLISAGLATIMFGIAYARQVIATPVVSHHETGVAQFSLAPDEHVLCTTRYIANINNDGRRRIHKSVDCDE
jgi:hypothetical protein